MDLKFQICLWEIIALPAGLLGCGETKVFSTGVF